MNGFRNFAYIEGPRTDQAFTNLLKQEHSTFIVIAGHNQKATSNSEMVIRLAS